MSAELLSLNSTVMALVIVDKKALCLLFPLLDTNMSSIAECLFFPLRLMIMMLLRFQAEIPSLNSGTVHHPCLIIFFQMLAAF